MARELDVEGVKVTELSFWTANTEHPCNSQHCRVGSTLRLNTNNVPRRSSHHGARALNVQRTVSRYFLEFWI